MKTKKKVKRKAKLSAAEKSVFEIMNMFLRKDVVDSIKTRKEETLHDKLFWECWNICTDNKIKLNFKLIPVSKKRKHENKT